MENFDVSKKNISEKIAEYLKELILEGKYPINSKLPGEREMAAQLNISRNTVREAYKILEAYGFITVKHGSGIYVAPTDYQIKKMTSFFFFTNDKIKDLFEIRKILECAAVEWAIINSSNDQLEKLTNIVDEAKDLVSTKNFDYEDLSKLDLQFHLTLADMSHNVVLIRIMQNLIDLLEGSRVKSIKIPGRPIQSIHEHEDIVKAIQKKDIKLSQYYMLKHLNSVEESILQSLDQEGNNENIQS